MIQLKHNPFPLVFAQGDAATQLACLALFEQSGSPRGRASQEALLERQRPDGAFPSAIDPAHWGTLETVRIPLLLLQAGLSPDAGSIAGAVRFLLDHQNPDGGWCENPALKVPPDRVELSSEKSITWVTADAVDLLRRGGQGEHGACRAALEWLKSTQNRYGGWRMFERDSADQPDSPGDPDSSAQITFLLGEVYGSEDPAFLKGRELFEKNLDQWGRDVERGYRVRYGGGQREELDGYTLTCLLLSSLVDAPRRFESGYDVRDPRVTKILHALVDIQRPDGGWNTFWSRESSPVYTALAVKVLVLGGAVQRKDLLGSLRAYAVQDVS